MSVMFFMFCAMHFWAFNIHLTLFFSHVWNQLKQKTVSSANAISMLTCYWHGHQLIKMTPFVLKHDHLSLLHLFQVELRILQSNMADRMRSCRTDRVVTATTMQFAYSLTTALCFLWVSFRFQEKLQHDERLSCWTERVSKPVFVTELIFSHNPKSHSNIPLQVIHFVWSLTGFSWEWQRLT